MLVPLRWRDDLRVVRVSETRTGQSPSLQCLKKLVRPPPTALRSPARPNPAPSHGHHTGPASPPVPPSPSVSPFPSFDLRKEQALATTHRTKTPRRAGVRPRLVGSGRKLAGEHIAPLLRSPRRRVRYFSSWSGAAWHHRDFRGRHAQAHSTPARYWLTERRTRDRVTRHLGRPRARSPPHGGLNSRPRPLTTVDFHDQ